MKVTTEGISPDDARAYFNGHVNFRKVNQEYVNRLANDMREGRWSQNGDSIKFNSLGKLVDGQHRLLAVIQSRRPLTTLVVRGVEASPSMDTGKPRTAPNFLAHLGYTNANTLASAASSCLKYEYGTLKHAGGNRGIVSAHQIVEFVEKNPSLCRIMKECMAMRQKYSMWVSGCVFVMFQAHIRDLEQLGREFAHGVLVGTNLPETSAVFKFRARLLADRSSKLKLQANEKYALAIKAWLYHRDDRPCSLLRYGASESFPSFDD